MACFIVPVPSTHHQRFPVMRRRLHPYFSSDWLDYALANEETHPQWGGCGAPVFRPVLRIRRPDFKLIKSKDSKQSDTGDNKKATLCDCDDKCEPVTGKKSANTEASQNKSKTDDFRLTAPIGKLNPKDLKVKVADRVLTVTGKTTMGSEEDDVYGVVSFSRRYTLPKNVDVDALTSKLTEDGVLVFEAPLLALEEANEKQIPVTMEGRQELSEEKENPEMEKEDPQEQKPVNEVSEENEEPKMEAEKPKEHKPVKDDVTEEEA